jgi:hypothetical protein
MNRLTKFALAATAVFTVCSTPVFASAGIFGTAAVVSFTLGGTTTNDVLEATLLRDSENRLDPSSPTLSPLSYDASGDDANSTLNLGTFTLGTDSLTFAGGEVLTFKSGSDNFTGADVYYSIDNGSFVQIPLSFNEDNVAGSTGDQRWYIDTNTGNLISGLSAGSHTLSFYFDATDNYGTGIYTPVVNNSGPNYTASFTVVPEPSTLMMLLSSGLFGSFYLISRRRK